MEGRKPVAEILLSQASKASSELEAWGSLFESTIDDLECCFPEHSEGPEALGKATFQVING